MAAAPAAGALVGAALTGWVGRAVHPGRWVIVAVTGWGLAITAFGLSSGSFPLALFFLALAGAADVISAVLRSSIWQLETPDALRGRVASIHVLVVTSGPRIGDAEAAAVAAVVGPQLSVISGGILSSWDSRRSCGASPSCAAMSRPWPGGPSPRPRPVPPGRPGSSSEWSAGADSSVVLTATTSAVSADTRSAAARCTFTPLAPPPMATCSRAMIEASAITGQARLAPNGVIAPRS